MDDDRLLGVARTLGRGATRLVRRLHAERPEHSLAPMPLSVLFHLQRRGPLTPTDVASADRIQPQSLTRVLTALESEGLITRQPDSSDGRRSRLAITGTGRQALDEVLRRRDAWLAQAMAAQLTPTECEVLRLAGELMERLADVTTGATRMPVGPAIAARRQSAGNFSASVSKSGGQTRGVT